MDDRHLTQLYAESFKAQRPLSPTPTTVSAHKEFQGQSNHKLTKGRKQQEKPEKSKNPLFGPAQDVRQSSSQSERQTAQAPVIRRGSPWHILKDLFTCDLAGPVSIAVHKKGPSEVIAVRAFSKEKADVWLQVIQQTQHPNVISATEIFKDLGMTYFIVDDLPLTLEHLVACDIFPSELQLASILVQVRIISHSKRKALTQKAGLEHCIGRQPTQSQAQTLRALTNVTMFLMQKYLKPDSVIGIDGTRWRSDPLEFLSATASVATIQELRKVS
ncbi:hypothetical protein CBS147354_9534 [Penicillium roqueforti]|nr:hypothetical protein CBS147354_9534 [Penicillium roqueforti]